MECAEVWREKYKATSHMKFSMQWHESCRVDEMLAMQYELKCARSSVTWIIWALKSTRDKKLTQLPNDPPSDWKIQIDKISVFCLMHFLEFLWKFRRCCLCSFVTLFIISCWKFSAVFIFFGFGPGFTSFFPGVNDTLTEKYWSDETREPEKKEFRTLNKFLRCYS